MVSVVKENCDTNNGTELTAWSRKQKRDYDQLFSVREAGSH